MTAPVTSAGRSGAGGPGADARRPPSPWRVLALVLAAVAAALLGVAFSGAALPALLRDPGAAVRWGLPATETLTELAGSVTLGALVLAVCVLPRRAAVASTRSPRVGVGTADGIADGAARGRGAASVSAHPARGSELQRPS